VDWLKQVRFSKIRQKLAEIKIIGKNQQKSTKISQKTAKYQQKSTKLDDEKKSS